MNGWTLTTRIIATTRPGESIGREREMPRRRRHRSLRPLGGGRDLSRQRRNGGPPQWSGHPAEPVRRSSIGWFSAVILALVLCSGPLSVAANEATPQPTANAPDPSLCQAEAPSRTQLNAEIAAATTAAQATPGMRLPGRLAPDVVPTGVPADDPTIAAITATTRQLVACFNAGEPLRALGLYTPIARGALYVRQGPLSGSAYDALATPLPAAPAKRDEIVAIRNVRLLPDGRVGATVTIAYAVVPEPKTFFFVYARAADERWLIDGILGELSFSVP